MGVCSCRGVVYIMEMLKEEPTYNYLLRYDVAMKVHISYSYFRIKLSITQNPFDTKIIQIKITIYETIKSENG